MADTKISALPAATTPLAGSEVLPIVQSGVTDKVSVANLTAGRDIATKQITSTVSGVTTALDGWSITNGVANAFFKLSGATYGYRGIGSNYVWIGGDGSPMYIGTSTAQPVRMGTNAFQQLTLETSGDVTVNTNNLVIGTSGNGIDFSATPGTGTSELLADYEEGTWSSVLSDGTNNSAASTAYYTKIGRIVYVTMQMYGVNVSALTAAAALRITGLPFAPANYVNGFMSVPFAAAGTILVQFGGSTYVNLYVANGIDSENWQAFTRNIEAGAASMSIYGQFFYIT
jgi:hypothetical protein